MRNAGAKDATGAKGVQGKESKKRTKGRRASALLKKAKNSLNQVRLSHSPVEKRIKDCKEGRKQFAGEGRVDSKKGGEISVSRNKDSPA